MAERRNYIALEWLTGEIEETLKQARQALEDFVADRDDLTKLRFCLTYAHQVHGSLKMLELHGAALLAAEIESLAKALVNQRVEDINTALEAMMTGLLKLSAHVQRINVTKEEQPAVLLNIVNELRAARGAEAHNEAAIFNPDLSAAPRPQVVEKPAIQHDEFNELARKIRQLYQTAMVSVVRDQQVDKAYEILLKVLARIHKISHRTAAEPLWKIAHAVIQALAASNKPADNPSKTALRQIDNEIKKLSETGRDALEQRPAAALLKSLLYSVATAPVPTELVREIQKQYRLKEALPLTVAPAGSDVALPDAEAVRSVISAINEELAQIQDVLDLLSRDELSQPNLARLEGTLPIFQRVIGTMSVLGASDALRIMREQFDATKNILAQPQSVTPTTLLEIAAQIMAVQDALRNSKSIDDARSFNALQNQLSQAHATVMREARSGLEQAKEAVIEFVASQWDHAHLAGVPALLEQMRGGLIMIPLPRAAAVLACCNGYIRDKLLGERVVPDWRLLDTLADAISSVEYYLECLSGDHRADIDDILTVAEESVAQLGYPVTRAAEIVHAVQDDADADDEDEYRNWDPEAEDSVAASAALEEPAALEPSSVGADDVPALVAAAPDFAEPAEALSEELLSTQPLSEQPSTEQIAEEETAEEAAAEPVAAAPAAAEDDNDDMIDDEIVEIFIEEAAEVIAHINEYFPQWQAEPDNRDVLIEIRRSFHTLKGSGRMVGAKDVGELAWSVENMLNRVLDGTHPSNAPRMAMVEEAKDLAPSMVDAFHQRRRIDLTAAHNIQAMALQLSQGIEPEIPTLVMSSTGIATSDFAAPSANEAASAEADATESSASENAVAEDIDAEHVADHAVSATDDDAIVIDLPDVEPVVVAESSDSDDIVLRDIFRTEALTHRNVLRAFITDAQAATAPIELSEQLQRALHTMKGSAHMAGATPLAEMITPVERLVKELRSFHVRVDEEILAVLDGSVQFIELGIEQLDTDQTAPLDGVEEFTAEVEGLHHRYLVALGVTPGASHPEIDNNQSVVLLVDGMEKLLHASDLLSAWTEHSLPQDQLQQLYDDVRNLHAAAVAADQSAIVGLAQALVTVYQRVIDGEIAPSQRMFDRAQHGHEALIDMMDLLAAGQNVRPAQTLIDELEALRSEPIAAVVELSVPHIAEDIVVKGVVVEDIVVEDSVAEDSVAEELAADADSDTIDIVAFEPEVPVVPVEAVAQVTGFIDDIEVDDQDADLASPAAAEVSFVEPATVVADVDDDIEFVLDEESHESAAEDASAETGWFAPQPAVVESTESADEEIDFATLESETAESPAISIEINDAVFAEGELPVITSAVDLVASGVIESGFVDSDIAEANAAEDESGAEMASDEAELAWAAEHGVPITAADAPATDASIEELATFAGIEPPEDTVVVDVSAAVDESAVDDESAVVSESTAARVSTVADIKPMAVGTDAEQRLAAMLESIDPETLEVFLEEAADLMESIDESSHAWIADHDNTVHAEALKRYLHTLKGGARLAGITPLGDFTHDYETFLEGTRQFDNAFFRRLEYFQDRLHSMLEAVLSGNAASLMAPVQMPEFDTNADTARELPVAHGAEVAEDYDADVLEIFFEEARELQEAIDTAIAAWRTAPDDNQQLEELKRLLHTLKGGARLAGVKNLGNLSHNFETYLITAEQRGEAGNEESFATMQTYQDQLQVMVEEVAARLQGGKPVVPEAPLVLLEERVAATPEPGTEPAPLSETGSAEAGSNVVPFRRQVDMPAPAELPVMPQILISQASIDATRSFVEQFERGQSRGRGAQEVVKVAAQLLEDLVNLAGETSISRARVEEQMSEMSFSVEEFDMTIDRLKGQLRRLEIETDAQIVYRQELLVVEGHEGFDPLEMDRYTHMQQLSRSLIESASDLQDLRDTFTNKIRDIETLLLQQSRVNTELQEGLMRSQMVPFARMVPRLRRIVRQVASELGKQVDLVVENDEGELDRTVLERMVAPLEHMLRNAVDHGIEALEDRRASGKPTMGTIRLSVGREGGDVLLNLSDDGGGIDFDAVRSKAIERGLMTDDTDLSQHEILQFILHAGFSTAKKVTQISGRGVGMDVVHSEIKQLGGSMDISSVRGSGTQFTVRLPFTVSVNRALMVCIGSDTYAIPLNTIEGIVRVSPYELEAYYQPNAPQFEYAGQSYNMRYIGGLLNMDSRPKLEGQTMPLPVVLIRGGDHAVAVQVDRLLGSREIVVKTLGPQFSMVDGLSGATVLGDGSVVVILDLHALIRADISRAHRQHMLEEIAHERDVQRVLRVMVVDDSVTVRKVTSRLLERLGVEVSTAKDGVDAVAKLNEAELLPDVMLLDIEMPRMDGFEVASRVRHTGRLQHIPIIMITSRTGEKHRERALSLGVNKYMGKPYQESELLDAISALTEFDIAR